MEYFEGIYVEDHDNCLIGRNEDERVLFKYNKIVHQFSVFRSHRMTDREKEFLLLMADRFSDKSNIDKDEFLKFLNYEIENDVYCS
jgi:hypothetical protein